MKLISIRKMLNGKVSQSSGQKISLMENLVEAALADHAKVALAAVVAVAVGVDEEAEEAAEAGSSSFLSKTRL